jgi:hypothetical protein
VISGVPRADDLTDEQLMRIARRGLDDEEDEDSGSRAGRGRGAARRSYTIDAPPDDITADEWAARHAPRPPRGGRS